MPLTYAIIEDEDYVRDNLARTISRLRPDMKLVFESGSVKEAIDFFGTLPDVSLIFMDIELSDGNCFEIFDRVAVHSPIIFTTAYNEFALQAFEVYSLDYLLKPISDADLLKAIEKFERVTLGNPRDWRHLTGSIGQQIRGGTDRILVSSGDSFSYFNVPDIAFFEADDGYIFAVQHDGKRRITNFANLQEVIEKTGEESFFQISRKIVVNIDALVKVSKHFRGRLLIRYKAGQEEYTETVSSTRRDDFLRWLGQ